MTFTTEQTVMPRVFLHDATALCAVRRRVQAGELAQAVACLRRDADAALTAGPFSVLDKPQVAPSGDPHDYYSFGPYWWPDPNAPDGLPYIRRDGELNPESKRGDRQSMEDFAHTVTTLAQAAWVTGHAAYAERAAVLLRTWFLDDATRMNPHLEYGQAIPGRVDGRGIGIIDTVQLVPLIDAIGMLAGAPCWTAEDQDGVRRWFHAYLQWLLTSTHGQEEGREHNNHGAWYDVQVAIFALFCGEDGTAQQALERCADMRIVPHIAADGSQPHELARTRGLSYSLFNLTALMNLATLGQRVGLDLWSFTTTECGGIRRAVAWLMTYADGSPFPYQQIVPIPYATFVPLLRRAALAYHDATFEHALASIPGVDVASDRVKLLYPLPAHE